MYLLKQLGFNKLNKNYSSICTIIFSTQAGVGSLIISSRNKPPKLRGFYRILMVFFIFLELP